MNTSWVLCTDSSAQRAYYYNVTTRQSSWGCPPEAAVEVTGPWIREIDQSGKVRFFNRASGMHSERVPPSELPPSRTARSGDGVWIKTFDKATGLPFFFNNDTGESTWKQPSGVTFYEDEVASSSALSRPQFTELASVPPKTRAEVERAREFLVTKFGEWPPRRLKDILREVPNFDKVLDPKPSSIVAFPDEDQEQVGTSHFRSKHRALPPASSSRPEPQQLQDMYRAWKGRLTERAELIHTGTLVKTSVPSNVPSYVAERVHSALSRDDGFEGESSFYEPTSDGRMTREPHSSSRDIHPITVVAKERLNRGREPHLHAKGGSEGQSVRGLLHEASKQEHHAGDKETASDAATRLASRLEQRDSRRQEALDIAVSGWKFVD